jgi:hypothetical protein
MRDYMPRDGDEGYGGEPSFSLDMQFVRSVLGILLVVAGGTAALWICMTIFGIFDDPQKIEIFNQIIPLGQEIREFRIDEKSVVLPRGVFTFLAYFLGVLLLAVAARVALGLISSGIKLLQPSLQKLEMRIGEQFQQMETKMADGMEKLGNSMVDGVLKLQEKAGELFDQQK